VDQFLEIYRFLLFRETRIYGASFCILVFIVFLVSPKFIKDQFLFINRLRCDLVAKVLFFGFFGIALIYLAYPNFLDHIESTVANTGIVLRSGADLYPYPDLYPYHGILYGPALAVVQSVFQGVGLNILLASKLPGVLAFLVSFLLLFRIANNRNALGYLLYLLPFGMFLFWNRADSFLLFLVTVALFWGDGRAGRWSVPIVLGVLAGIASALKIHGGAYVFAAYLAVSYAAGISLLAVLAFVVCAASTFLLFFALPHVSLGAFFAYLQSASVHGISLKLIFYDLLYLLFMSIPLLILLRRVEFKPRVKAMLLSVFSVQLFVALMAAKPGSGVYHLMPFLALNSYLLARFSRESDSSGKMFLQVLYLALVIPSMVAAHVLVYAMTKSWPEFSASRQELTYFDDKYQNVVMGLSDHAGYPYVYPRIELRTPQIDYPAFMDLQFSGKSDAELVARIDACEIEHILVPNKGIWFPGDGQPFSMINYYTSRPLFSNELKESFAKHYQVLEVGTRYILYVCKNPADS